MVKKGVHLDNRYVVPYNPQLLLRYNCHINVEVVTTIKAIKYMYKYVYKGHDVCMIELKQRAGQSQEQALEELRRDEPKYFTHCRYCQFAGIANLIAHPYFTHCRYCQLYTTSLFYHHCHFLPCLGPAKMYDANLDVSHLKQFLKAKKPVIIWPATACVQIVSCKLSNGDLRSGLFMIRPASFQTE